MTCRSVQRSRSLRPLINPWRTLRLMTKPETDQRPGLAPISRRILDNYADGGVPLPLGEGGRRPGEGRKNTFLLTRRIAVVLCVLLLEGCTNRRPSPKEDSTLSVPPALLLPSTADTDEQTLRFLQNRIKEDADDFIA